MTKQHFEQEKTGQSESLSLSFDVTSLVQGIRVKPAEFARMCGCSRQAVSRWVKEGLVSLYPDGTLDPQAAAKSILGKRDPRRVKAAIFRDLAQSTDDLRKQLKAQAAELAATRRALEDAKDDAAFHEGSSFELLDYLNALPVAIASEWELLSTVNNETVAALLDAWKEIVFQDGLANAPMFVELLEYIGDQEAASPCANSDGRGAQDA